jgi:hypothetical protein
MQGQQPGACKARVPGMIACRSQNKLSVCTCTSFRSTWLANSTNTAEVDTSSTTSRALGR